MQLWVSEKLHDHIADGIQEALRLLAQKPLHDLLHVHITPDMGCRGL